MTSRERLRQWFFRRQGPESGPIDLQRQNIYILPTKTGVLYVLVLVVMYIGAVNYNLGLGHALVFLLVGLGLTGMLHTFRNLVGLRIRSGRVDPVFAGEAVDFEVIIENMRQESRPGIHLQKFGGNATFDRNFIQRIDLGKQQLKRLPISLIATRRGMLQLPRLSISTQYPLGLFRAWSYPWPNMKCIVYPKPIHSPLPPPLPTDHNVGGHSQETDNPDDFAGFRRHRPGDSPRHVAWKLFARSATDSPPQIKEFTGNALAELRLGWDQTDNQADIENRLSTLCGWILTAYDEELAFGLEIPGFQLPVGMGDFHKARALEALALFDLKP